MIPGYQYFFDASWTLGANPTSGWFAKKDMTRFGKTKSRHDRLADLRIAKLTLLYLQSDLFIRLQKIRKTILQLCQLSLAISQAFLRVVAWFVQKCCLDEESEELHRASCAAVLSSPSKLVVR